MSGLDDAGLYIGMNVYTWAAFSLTAVLSVGRYALHRFYHKRLYAEDWIHMLALTFLCGYAIARTFVWQYLQELNNTSRGLFGGSSDDDRAYFQLQEVGVIAASFYFAAVFAAKAVFLALYWRVFRGSRAFLAVWLLAAFVTFAGYVAAFVAQFFVCNGNARDFTSSLQVTFDCGNNFFRIVQNISIVVIVCNMVTYLLVIALPLIFLRRRQPRFSRAQLAQMSAPLLLLLGAMASSLIYWVSIFPDVPTRLSLAAYDAVLYLEPLLAILAAALPPWGRLLSKASRRHLADGTTPITAGMGTAGGGMGGGMGSAGGVLGTGAGTARGGDVEAAAAGGGAGAGGVGAGAGAGGANGAEMASMSTSTAERDKEANQYLQVDVPSVSRSYWHIPGLRTSTRTTDMPGMV